MNRPRANPLPMWLLAASSCLAWAGCGSGTNLSEVTGVVSFEGRPITQGVQIVFTPQAGDARPARGVTNDRGQYTMYYEPGMKGLRPGSYTVSIQLPGKDPTAPPVILPPELARIKIPARFLEGSSTLTCDVKRSGTVFDIDIRPD